MAAERARPHRRPAGCVGGWTVRWRRGTGSVVIGWRLACRRIIRAVARVSRRTARGGLIATKRHDIELGLFASVTG